jgi:hypothetical protein
MTCKARGGQAVAGDCVACALQYRSLQHCSGDGTTAVYPSSALELGRCSCHVGPCSQRPAPVLPHHQQHQTRLLTTPAAGNTTRAEARQGQPAGGWPLLAITPCFASHVHSMTCLRLPHQRHSHAVMTRAAEDMPCAGHLAAYAAAMMLATCVMHPPATWGRLQRPLALPAHTPGHCWPQPVQLPHANAPDDTTHCSMMLHQDMYKGDAAESRAWSTGPDRE